MKYEIIVRETRVLKYTIEAPSEQIAVDRIITDFYGNPEPHQTTRLSREIYAVHLPSQLAGNQTSSGVPWMPTAAAEGPTCKYPPPPGLTPYPGSVPTPITEATVKTVEPVVKTLILKKKRKGKKK